MTRTPDVLTGLRDPQMVRLEKAAEREASGTQVPRPAASTKFTVYESLYRRYRVQITSPDEVKDTKGRIHRDRPLVCQFEDGRFTNNNPVKAVRDYIESCLAENPHFGLDKHFWLKSEADARDLKHQKAQTRRVLATLPVEDVQAMIAEMVESGELDLALPNRSKMAVEISTIISGGDPTAGGAGGVGGAGAE